MGFLDFLKKDKQPTISPASVQVPPPPGSAPAQGLAALPSDPSQIDWNAPPRMESDLPPLPPNAPEAPARPENSVPTGTMLANPLRRDPLPPELERDDGDFNHVPLPPVSMQDPDFLDSAADDLRPKQPQVIEKIVERVVEVPAAPAVANIELPDFTDEELEAFQATVSAKPAPAAAAPPATLPPLPKTMQIVTEVPIVEAPANAVAIPPEDIRLPTGEDLEIGRMQPAKFISAGTYFTLIADIRAVRKSLRQNDDVIKEATLRHEQLDLQYKRVAADINAVQESFMKIDAALFEE